MQTEGKSPVEHSLKVNNMESASISGGRNSAEGVESTNILWKYWSSLKPFSWIILVAIVGAILSWFIQDYLLDKAIPKPPVETTDTKIIKEYFKSLNTFLAILKTLGSITIAIVATILGSFYKIYKERGEAFSYVWEAKGTRRIDKNIAKLLLPFLRKKWDEQLMALIRLSEDNEHGSKYTVQLNIADTFSHIAAQKFWTTSLDLPSEFWMRNEAYIDSLQEMGISGVDDDIPKSSRVFVAPFKDLVKDIAGKSVEVTEAFQWHLEWNRQSGNHDPIRFLTCQNDYTDYLDLFSYEQNKLGDHEMIPDFMIVDDKFIYGRRSLKVEHDRRVNLGYLPGGKKIGKSNTEASTVYRSLFRNIWYKADEIDDLEKKIRNAGGIIHEAIEELVSEISYRKSVPENKEYIEQLKKQKVVEIDAFFEYNLTFRETFRNKQEFENRYGSYFRNATDGELFYRRVAETIEDAEGVTIAVDRADKKEEGQRFYQAWKSQREYKGFFDASAIAAQKGTVYRVFVIEDLVAPKDTHELDDFIRMFLDANMRIGIVLNNQEILSQISDAFNSDFIITNIYPGASTPVEMFGSSFGFETKDKEFKINRLNYSENLVPPRRLELLYNTYRKLWQQPNCLKFESRLDLENMYKLIKREEAK